MITIGVDAHKRSHTAVAVNQLGRRHAELTVAATAEGVAELWEWARQWPQRCWGVEDCRHVTRLLEELLLEWGETVIRVPPALTGPSRRLQRNAGKSDPVDAETVARVVQAHPGLPQAAPLPPVVAEISELWRYREQAVASRTELINRLHHRLHQLDPSQPKRRLDTQAGLNQVTQQLANHQQLTAELAHREVTRIRALTTDINQVTRRLQQLTTLHTPQLLAIPGCGAITAAAIVTQIGDIHRFPTRAKFARYTGTAPIPVSSGQTHRMRLHRGGNRQLNRALHTIAITQARCHPPAKAYLARKQSQGKTKTEALRALKRHLANATYKALTATTLT